MWYIIFMPHKRRHSGIYCFENKINGKKYIGQAYNIERRLYEHEYHIAKGTDHSEVLQRAVNKYGIENFRSYVLEECKLEDMNEREIYWINYYQTNNSNYGYNLSRGGEKSLLGHKFPLEFGRKISAMKKGTHLSEEHKNKISKAQKGKTKSKETRKKMSANHSRYWLGKKMPQETVERLKIAHGGKNAYQFGAKNKGSTSKYHGVHKNTQKGGRIYWIVQVHYCGKKHYAGCCKDELEAARMYDSYVIAHNLPNPLNFPNETNEAEETK